MSYAHIGPVTRSDLPGKNEILSSSSTWVRVWIVFTLVFVLLAVVVVGISLFKSSDADSITRFCIKATADQVVGGPGEVGGYLEGTFELNTESNVMSYYFYFPTTMSQITSIVVMGPRNAGQEQGDEYFSLCGAPNLVNVCDVLTVPGLVKGSLTQRQPGNQDNGPAIEAIRAQPSPHYYIEVRTANFPNSPGALRASLSSTCGFP